MNLPEQILKGPVLPIDYVPADPKNGFHRRSRIRIPSLSRPAGEPDIHSCLHPKRRTDVNKDRESEEERERPKGVIERLKASKASLTRTRDGTSRVPPRSIPHPSLNNLRDCLIL